MFGWNGSEEDASCASALSRDDTFFRSEFVVYKTMPAWEKMLRDTDLVFVVLSHTYTCFPPFSSSKMLSFRAGFGGPPFG